MVGEKFQIYGVYITGKIYMSPKIESRYSYSHAPPPLPDKDPSPPLPPPSQGKETMHVHHVFLRQYKIPSFRVFAGSLLLDGFYDLDIYI